MIKFEQYQLNNGLKVILHKDKTTPICAINVLYNVGARDENPEKTGFAHLFEHLMFGGSKNIPCYDKPLQLVGGENNAFTNNDYTNYYITLPKNNIETGLWLESDRMLQLAFSKKSLNVQKNVVCEEFKQRYLNQPYGDVWLLLRPLAYNVHPYKWATIGKELSHIENATLNDVKEFFYKFYRPNNAILTIAGDIDFDKTKKLVDKWFGNIPAGEKYVRNLEKEPVQSDSRMMVVAKDVPYDSIYKVYHMCDRLDKNYYATDFLSDVLSNGDSSRLYQNLVKKGKIFSDINAYISGSIEAGLFIFSGHLIEGVSMDEAEKAIKNEIEKINNGEIKDEELQKVKNKIETSYVFSEISVLDKAMNLAYYELLGDANMHNEEIKKYLSLNVDDIKKVSKKILTEANSSTLYYHSKK